MSIYYLLAAITVLSLTAVLALIGYMRQDQQMSDAPAHVSERDWHKVTRRTR